MENSFKHHKIRTSWLVIFFFMIGAIVQAKTTIPNVILAIHGGASDHEEIPPSLEPAVREAMTQALKAGYVVLKNKGSSLDAVEAAERVLEDSPLFNAGRGAVFTEEGKNELDASIMEGKEKRTGAVASVSLIKNPVSAARAVMERTRHVMLVGDGAEAFAKKEGLEMVDPSYFRTERRWKEHLDGLKKRKAGLQSRHLLHLPHFSLGTTGSVALDATGTLTAATSTGGLTNKMHGRIGDSPIIGAGTYADNEACAISCTGVGEYFIRFGVAHEICSLVKHKGWSIARAADELIQKKLKALGAEGAVIALDPKGNLAFSYNSETLPRGYVTRDGKITVELN